MSRFSIDEWLSHLSSSIESESLNILQRAILVSQNYLSDFANDRLFLTKMKSIFDSDNVIENDSNDEKSNSQPNNRYTGLRDAWLNNDFSILSNIEIVTANELEGANGAYSARIDKIYLAVEFLAQNQENIDEIARVLIEEGGHRIDAQLNKVDRLGDEGEFFSAVVFGENLSDERVQKIQNEDDRATIILNGETIEIEQNNVVGTQNDDFLSGTPGDDLIEGFGGNDEIEPDTGMDTIIGGEGEDYLYLYNSNDIVNVSVTYLDPNNGSITGGANDGTIFSQIEAIYLETGSGNDTIDLSATTIYTEVYAGDGNDIVITNNTGDNYISGDGGDDNLQGGSGFDELYGDDGNDTLAGVNSFDANPGQGEIDYFEGGLGADRIILGTEDWIAYDDNDPNSNGTNDYAEIWDFNPAQGDVVQLQSSPGKSYRLEVVGSDTELYLVKGNSEADELIAIFYDNTSLDLDSPTFEYKYDAAIIIVVTNTNDTGEGSLRWAIEQANSDSAINLIRFDIATEEKIIQPLTALPTITNPVIIDATTQTGYEGIPLVELNGSLSDENTNGLEIRAGNSTVKGLVINNFNRGISLLDNGNNTIQSNFIGTDATGTQDLGNSREGIYLNSAGNLIGGDNIQEGNVVSGNNGVGILLQDSSANNNTIAGNYIGTNFDGTSAIGNNVGIVIASAGDNIIENNLVSGNTNTGLGIEGNASVRNQVLNNYIGTNIDTTGTLGNGNVGLDLPGAIDTLVRGNIIGGNNAAGISVRNTQRTIVENNFIGTDITGVLDLGNPQFGIADNIDTIDAVIRNNKIAFNPFAGIRLEGKGYIIESNQIYDNGKGIEANSTSLGNKISANSIYNNNQLGIDLENNGVTPNDLRDSDTGANNLQNYPILTSAIKSGNGTTIEGTLNSKPNETYQLEFFANNIVDSSGYGEGEIYLGFIEVTTNSNGDVNFNSTLSTSVSVGQFISATATDSQGNTSEFSATSTVIEVTEDLTVNLTQINPSNPSSGEIVTVTWQITNTGNETITGSWDDRIYLSANASANQDILLGTFSFSGTIAVGETIERTESITIPENTSGNRSLSVVVDANNVLQETNENNNIDSIQIPFTQLPLSANSGIITGLLTDADDLNLTREGSYSIDHRLVDVVTNRLVTLQLDSEDFDAYIQLINADTGEVINFDDDTGGRLNAQLSFIPEEGINYEVRVTTYNYQDTGSYTLTASNDGVDLIITNIVVPEVALNGEEIEVFFNIVNQGTLPTITKNPLFLEHPSEYHIYFSEDNTFNPNEDINLASFSDFAPIIEAGQTVTPANTPLVRLPNNVSSGNYYLFFVADALNAQVEIDENNNVTAVPISLNVEFDIDLRDLDFPNIVVSGERAIANFTYINNFDLSLANREWNIGFYVSEDEILDDNDVFLSPGFFGSYDRTIEQTIALVDFRLPQAQSLPFGNYYLIAKADYLDRQPEIDETNNTQVIPFTLVGTNLELTTATAPDVINLGESFPISWTVTNTGDFAVPINVDNRLGWRIYLSQNDVFDDGDYFINSLADYEPINLPIQPGISVTASANANWSSSIIQNLKKELEVGENDYYVLFSFDDSDFAETDKGDNFYAYPTKIIKTEEQGGKTNLSISESDVNTNPQSANLGDTITVYWKVTNNGLFAIDDSDASWLDRIYLSDDRDIDENDLELGSKLILSQSSYDFLLSQGFIVPSIAEPFAELDVNESYEIAVEFTLPQDRSITGDKYILIATDNADGLSETDETDNQLDIPITLTPPTSLPDLVITEVNLSSEVVNLGENIDISWRVENVGEVVTSISWQDLVYLSDDPFFDESDTELTNLNGNPNGSLAPGESYLLSTEINLPEDRKGAYLVFNTDALGEVWEEDDTNNWFARPIKINLPNLEVLQVSVSEPIILGDTVDITWTVKNTGLGDSVTGFFDGIYLSNDPYKDPQDIFITSTFVDSLAVGETIEISETIDLSASQPGGELYLLVETGEGVYETAREDNVYALPITIEAPNLTITNQTAPSIALANEEITISWDVINEGTVTATTNWSDRVYLSTDENLDDDDRILITRTRSNLNPQDSYRFELNVNLPGVTSGDYHLIFVTDDDRDQGETNEDNNFTTLPITINTPNLTVTEANIPQQLSIGERLEVTWTVQNISEYTAVGNWSDAIFLSDDDALDNSDIFLGSQNTSSYTPLLPDNSYTISETINIPIDRVGDRYILFVANRNGVQGETDQNDNILAVPVNIDTNGPNLTITAAEAPSFASVGAAIDISWTVENTGNIPAVGDLQSRWYDYVYLSEDPVLGGDRTLTTVNQSPNIPLDPGANYTTNSTINLPLDVEGNYYLIFSTDTLTDQVEADETDNTLVIPIIIDDRGPNLTVTNINAPNSATIRETIDVAWTVSNIGGVAAGANWRDRIYISDDPILNLGDEILDDISAAEYSPLANGDEYTISTTVTIPSNLTLGDKYLLVKTDDNKLQGETDELDNVSVIPLTILAPELIDLTVSEIVAPTEVISGQPLEISWFITNQGSDPITGTWIDRLLLSEDRIIGNDLFLGDFSFTGTIEAGQTIERKQVINIPIDISGEQWFVVKTDRFDRQFEYFAEDNNISIDDNPINIVLSPFPNLQVTNVNAPTNAFSSQETVIEWTVTNNGNAPTNAPFWYDRIWLSTDNVLDNSDVYLGQAVNPNFLQAGENYINQLTVTLPQGIDDNYFFIVQTDFNNNVYEFQNEDDNIGVSNVTDVQLTPPPDLQVTSVTAPNNAFSESTISLTWTVTNKGSGETLQSQWFDEIYLSSDDTLDSGDLFLEEFQHSGVLNANGSYTRTELVDLPFDLTGEYYFIVKTDGRENVYEQAFESNNTGFDDLTNIVLAPPAADFEVEFVDGDNTIIAGHNLGIEFEASIVENGFIGNWVDAFYLSEDRQLDRATDIYLGNYQVGYPDLYDEQSLPQNITTKVFTVGETDSIISFENLIISYLDFLIEGDLNDLYQNSNTFGRYLDILIDTNPITAILGEDYNITYVRGGLSIGPGFTPEIYGDRIAEDTESFELIVNSSIAGQSLITVNIIDNDTIGIPNITVGDVSAFEEEQEVYIPIILDKASTEPITVTYTTQDGTAGEGSDYNLTTGSVTFAPGEVVKNISVGIRNDLQKEEEESFNFVITETTGGVITDNSGTVTIFANNGYQKYPYAPKIPSDLEGDYYVVAVVDDNDSIFEFEEENNIIVSEDTVTIVAPGEDLIVSDLKSNSNTAQGGDYLYLDWTVTNNGTNGTIAFGNLQSRNSNRGQNPRLSGVYDGFDVDNISDRIVLSQNNILGDEDDIELAINISKPDVLPDGTLEFVRRNGILTTEEGGDLYVTDLKTGESYQRQLEYVEIPFGLEAGNYNLFVTTDADGFIDEAYETNNSRSIPIAIDNNVADLQISELNLLSGTNIQSGANFALEWTVTNVGNNRTGSPTWEDVIYLSLDSTISDDDIVLATRNHNNGLAQGDRYTKLYNGLIPIDTEGNYYVLVRTDDGNTIGESNESNNFVASTETINISLGDVPDLAVDSIDLPEIAISGQSLNIDWTIVNNGLSTEESFYTSFYLSLDQNLDVKNDVYLGAQLQQVGNTNNFTTSYDIPRGLSGRYYGFAVIDSSNEIYEREGENNNTSYDPISIEIILPPPSDLVVTDVIVPNNITLGEVASFAYTVQNQGTDDALGSWSDSVYLSTDRIWDLDDIFIGKYQHQGDIAVGDEYQGGVGLSGFTPITPGDYYVLVRSDIRNQVIETNDNNNLGVSLTQVTVDVEALPLSTPTTGILTQGEAVFYKVEIAEGESLLFNFDGEYDLSGFTELYVSYGEMPTRSEFDFNYQVPLEADQQILVPTTEAGTYYVMAYGNTVPEYTGEPNGFNYTIEVETIDFEILDTDFGMGGTAGNRTVKINGNKFDRTVTAKLTDDRGTELVASEYYRVDGNNLYATFDLTQLDPGIYDVTIENSQGETFTVNDSFEVVAGGGANISRWVDNPSTITRPVPGFPFVDRLNYNFNLNWFNDGINDAIVPVFTISSNDEFGDSMAEIVDGFGEYVRTFYGTASENGPAGIILPNQSRIETLVTRNSPIPRPYFSDILYQFNETYELSTEEFDWETVDLELTLLDIDIEAENPDPIFTQLIAQVGTTNGDFLQMLSENANLLPPELGENQELTDLLEIEVKEAIASLNNSISGRIFAPDFAVDISGQQVSAVNITTNELFVTTSLNDGSFVLETVTPGEYVISFASGVIINNDPITVTDGQSVSDLVLNAEEGATLTGVFTNSDTGESIVEAEITISRTDDLVGDFITIITDKNGRYPIPHLAPGEYILRTQKEGLADFTTEFTVNSLTEQIELNIQTVNAGKITGTITDRTGNNGLTDVTGALIPVGSEEVSIGFRTDENGDFSLDGIIPGEYEIVLNGVDYLEKRLDSILITEGQTTTINNQLTSGASITGQVVDSENNPINNPDIQVILYSNTLEIVDIAIVDAQGSYIFEDLSAGSYQIRVLQNAISLASVDVELQEGDNVVASNLNLPEITTISGTVFDDSGIALANAQVLIFTAQGEELNGTTTNSQGNFAFGVLQAGTYKITALSDRGVYNVANIEVPENSQGIDGITFNLGTQSIQGQVLSPDNNLLANVPVFLILDDETDVQLIETTTDEFGQFSFNGLVDGTYRIITDPDTNPNDFAPETVTVNINNENITNIVIQTEEQFTWQGIIQNSSNNPIPDAEIFVYKAGSNQLVTNTVTDSSGQLIISDLATGIYDFDVIVDGYALKRIKDIDISNDNTELNITLDGSQTNLTGRILSNDNNPIADELVFALDNSDRLIGWTSTNEEGAYEFTNLPSEVVRLEVETFGRSSIISDSINLGSTPNVSGFDLLLTPPEVIEENIFNSSSAEISPLFSRSDLGVNWKEDAKDPFDVIEVDPVPEIPPCTQIPGVFEIWFKVDRAHKRMEDSLKKSKGAHDKFQDTVNEYLPKINQNYFNLAKKIGLLVLTNFVPGSFAFRLVVKETINIIKDVVNIYSGLRLVFEAFLGGNISEGTNVTKTITNFVKTVGKLEINKAISETQAEIERLQEKPLTVGSIQEKKDRLRNLNLGKKLIAGFSAAQELYEVATVIQEIGTWTQLIEDAHSSFLTSYSIYERYAERAQELINSLDEQIPSLGPIRAKDDRYRVLEQGTISSPSLTFNDQRPECEHPPKVIGYFNPGVTQASVSDGVKFSGSVSFTTRFGGNVTLNEDGTFRYEAPEVVTDTLDFFYYYLELEEGDSGDNVGVAYFNIIDEQCDDGKQYEPASCHNQSADPNDILGPNGYGEENWIAARQPLNYTIRFENDAELATAPAQTVRITQKLDENLDLRTFRLGNFGFGEFIFEVSANQAIYQDRLDVTETLGVYVDVFAGIDFSAGEAFWELTAIDPETGEVPINVLEGFLPPNEDGLEGQGFVTYTVQAKEDVTTGTVIDAEASIVFDVNEPIITPPIFNTLDADKPISNITALPASTEETEFVVQWSGEDTDDGSGIASYTVFVSTNGGAFTPWLTETTETEAIFTGEIGKTYEFYSVAIDNAGNRQNLPLEAQASIFVDGEITASIGDFIWLDKNANGIQDEGENGLADITVTLYDNTNNAIDSITTDADGFYRFTDIAIGDYTLKVTAPNYLFSPQNQGDDDTLDSDFNPNTGITDSFTLSGDGDFTLDAGLYQTASITGTVWNDANGDGIQNLEENTIEGWTVYLDSNNNQILDDGEITTLTDGEGNYSFTDLTPGTYTVAQVLEENWQQTYPVTTTTGSNVRLFSPNSPLITSEIVSTSTTESLIDLDLFWADYRFANIKGQGYSTVIIDTGADLNHPFFGADNDGDGISDRIVYQYDFADNDNDASDVNNHGSHIASIIGSEDTTYTGIASESNLIILKIFGDDGSGTFADLETALQWVNNNADTYNIASVNLSLGDSQNWQIEESRYGIGDELAAIASQNIIVAAAAGNGFYTFNSEPGLAYPAIDPNVISVGAVWADNFGVRNFSSGASDYSTDTDRIASFSQRHSLLDIFAPGILITGADANGGTITMGGTSQATPYLTGVATLAQQIAEQYLSRKLTLNEFYYLLDNTSNLIVDGDDEDDNVVNTGETFARLNVLALAEEILLLESNLSNESGNNNGNNDSSDDSTSVVQTLEAITHTVDLDSGEIATGIDFGNQLINNAPIAVNLINTTTSLNENTDTSSGIKVGEIEIIDDGEGINQLSLSGSDSDSFEIRNGNELFFIAIGLDFETKAQYDVTVDIDDVTVGNTPDASTNFSLAITDVNTAPTAVNLVNITPSLNENTDTSAGIKVGEIEIIDDGEGINQLSLSGSDSNSFEIRNGNELFFIATGLDFETKTQYDVTVDVDDATVGNTPDTSTNFSLAISDVNTAPTAVNLINTTTSLNENADNSLGTKVGEIEIIDDGEGINQLSLSGSDSDSFEIRNGNELFFIATGLDFETKAQHDVTVNVDDTSVGVSPDASVNFSLAISDVNTAPTAVNLINTTPSLNENTDTSAGLKVGDIEIIDDGEGTNQLSLSGSDSSSFEIRNGNELFFIAIGLDFETKSSYDVIINVDDTSVGVSPDASANFSLAISDVNTAPTAVNLINTTTTLNENTDTSAGVKVGDIEIIDDGEGINQLSLSGSDSDSFEIRNGNELFFIATELDFETKSFYDVTINVDDTSVGVSPDASTNFSLAISDVNTAPTITSNPNFTLPENTIDIGIVTATDDDNSDLVNFTITNGIDRNLFSIDENTGELTFINPPDFENPLDDGNDNIYNLEITATDENGTGLSSSQDITVTVTDVDDTATNNPPEIDPGVVLYLQTGTSEAFSYTLPENLFTDPDSDELTISVLKKPKWLSYNSLTRELTGTAPATAETSRLVIEASDSQESILLRTKIIVSELQPVIGDSQTIITGDTNDRIITNDGSNYVLAEGGNDYIEGGEDDDYIFAGIGDDYINGNAGNDYIDGNKGRDLIFGGAGIDNLIGSGGQDILIGGEDDDILTGNGGRDIFALENLSGSDTVIGFKVGADKFGLMGSLSFSDLSIVQNGKNTDIFDSSNNLLATIERRNATLIDNPDNFVNLTI